jgi:hypothetical protein
VEVDMKRKILLVILSLLFTGATIAQDNASQVKYVVKNTVIREKPPRDQLVTADKAGVMALAAYIMANEGKGWYVDHMIDMALAKTNVNFLCDYSAVATMKVKFHFTWVGPSYYTVNYSNAVDVGPTSYNKIAVSFSGSLPFKKGTYRMMVIAEPQGSFSGAESVAECNFRLY